MVPGTNASFCTLVIFYSGLSSKPPMVQVPAPRLFQYMARSAIIRLRAMYFEYNGIEGGSCSTACESVSL